jgi:chemotaxis protein MotB
MILSLHSIVPQRISAAGYAEFHPVDTNDTPEGRAKNRRVDLVILPRAKINFAESGPSRPNGAWAKITDN